MAGQDRSWNYLAPKLLARLSKDYPVIWKIIDERLSEQGKSLPRWADWCFLPLASAAKAVRIKRLD